VRPPLRGSFSSPPITVLFRSKSTITYRWTKLQQFGISSSVPAPCGNSPLLLFLGLCQGARSLPRRPHPKFPKLHHCPLFQANFPHIEVVEGSRFFFFFCVTTPTESPYFFPHDLPCLFLLFRKYFFLSSLSPQTDMVLNCSIPGSL